MIRDKPVPSRVLDAAFDNFDELRTIDEMNDILADRHRVKMNSLMSKLFFEDFKSISSFVETNASLVTAGSLFNF